MMRKNLKKLMPYQSTPTINLNGRLIFFNLKFQARISKKLLEAAFTIQENSMEVGIYLTDISFENIAYNQDTDRVYFIDVENSVIVDKRQLRLDNPVFWNETYHLTRFDFDCFDCLKYNVDLMCTNYHVDINFYQGKI